VERTNTLRIRAPRQRILRLAAEVERWPDLLPHYRWVRVRGQLADGRRIVEMAANRDGIPVRWVAIQGVRAGEGIITFKHIGGPTLGMDVAWVLRDRDDGTVETRIEHQFAPAWPPLVGPWIARHVVGEFFIANVADKTLARIKEIAEAPVDPEGRPWAD